jgi:hypothetical protein
LLLLLCCCCCRCHVVIVGLARFGLKMTMPHWSCRRHCPISVAGSTFFGIEIGFTHEMLNKKKENRVSFLTSMYL